MMLGSEFARVYGPRGFSAWEGAAFALAREDDGLTPWPFVPLALADDAGHTAILQVQSDVLSIGTLDDHLRLPLTPTTAQSIMNLRGWLLPTPWLVFQIWRAAPAKLEPQGMVPNVGASMAQFVAHSTMLDGRIAALDIGPEVLRAGLKKSVVVDPMVPGNVTIFGWYRPPPAPDVFDDHRGLNAPNRQPVQPIGDNHSALYIDYSHGIRCIGPTAIVDGEPMATVDLYQHPTLSRLVSNRGPVRSPRYPSPVLPFVNRPAHVLEYPTTPIVVYPTPAYAERGAGLGVKRGG